MDFKKIFGTFGLIAFVSLLGLNILVFLDQEMPNTLTASADNDCNTLNATLSNSSLDSLARLANFALSQESTQIATKEKQSTKETLPALTKTTSLTDSIQTLEQNKDKSGGDNQNYGWHGLFQGNVVFDDVAKLPNNQNRTGTLVFTDTITQGMIQKSDNQQFIDALSLDKIQKPATFAMVDSASIESRTLVLDTDTAQVQESMEQKLLDLELVDIQTLDPSIRVDIRYAGTNNFMGKVLYNDCNKCYLQAEAAQMLIKAQEFLKEKRPNYSLLILDCARPHSVQKQMWAQVKGTDQAKYVASPYPYGSIHNYGAAVDLTIADKNGKELDMGTPYDYFGKLAQPRHQAHFANIGKLKKHHIDRRWLLKHVMKKAGFRAILTEWWHFEAFSKNTVRRRYKRID